MIDYFGRYVQVKPILDNDLSSHVDTNVPHYFTNTREATLHKFGS